MEVIHQECDWASGFDVAKISNDAKILIVPTVFEQNIIIIDVTLFTNFSKEDHAKNVL